MFTLIMISIITLIVLCIASMIAVLITDKRVKTKIFKTTAFILCSMITVWAIVMGKERQMIWLFILIAGLVIAVICELLQIRNLQGKIFEINMTQEYHAKCIDCLKDEVEVLEKLNKKKGLPEVKNE